MTEIIDAISDTYSDTYQADSTKKLRNPLSPKSGPGEGRAYIWRKLRKHASENNINKDDLGPKAVYYSCSEMRSLLIRLASGIGKDNKLNRIGFTEAIIIKAAQRLRKC